MQLNENKSNGTSSSACSIKPRHSLLSNKCNRPALFNWMLFCTWLYKTRFRGVGLELLKTFRFVSFQISKIQIITSFIIQLISKIEKIPFYLAGALRLILIERGPPLSYLIKEKLFWTDSLE